VGPELAGGWPVVTASSMEVRVGLGFDVHRLVEDPERPLVLGGCEFAGVLSLEGHSDGDAVVHAVTEALLGAAGLGDIGERFPDTDAALAGADSLDLLRDVSSAVRAEGWTVGNVDCSVICEEPRVAPMREEMQRRLSMAAAAPVTVKGRRPEQLGALGRGEGIACFAVAVLVRDVPPEREATRF
jgi:2-C-methyl-D-erythritol 2,4-cyclodiphosphate synthase